MVDALTRAGIAKPIKRPPIAGTGFGGIKLGYGLEVELCSGQVIRWSKKPLLFWHDHGKYLGLAEHWGPATSRPGLYHDMPGLPQKVPNLFKAFHGRKARTGLSWTDVEMSGKWVSLGAICRLDYASTKKGRRASYTHDHGRGVRLYRLGSDKRALWVIKGGSLNVTGRGIVK